MQVITAFYGCYIEFCKSCFQCAIVSGGESHIKQPLHTIPVQRPFQIIILNIMDLPMTDQGNKHVRTTFLRRTWSCCARPEDKELLTKEIIPLLGV